MADRLLHRRTDCRLCGAIALDRVLALTPTPPANAFVGPQELDRPQPVFPLDVFMCTACGHVQLLDVVDPQVLFADYVYVSGTSPAFVRHFEGYAADVLARYSPDAGALVVDVGSNDGTLLGFFRKAGMAVLGIDPAQAIAAEASQRGIETWARFFTSDLAREIVAARGPAAVVTANNVFAHADDLAGFAAAAKELLAPDGVFLFEVSYLGDVYEKLLFDTIYHEHLSYHSVKPLVPFFAAAGLELIRVERVASHGGSLRAHVQRAGGPHPRDGSVDDLIAWEEKTGLDRPETLKAFGARIDRLRDELAGLLADLRADGKRIAGYGAPAKATTLMHHFGLGRETVEFICDDSPLKQGLYTPGLHVPVVSADELYARRPDYLLVLAWNFAEPILAKHDRFRQEGGRFIVPLPELRIVEP